VKFDKKMNQKLKICGLRDKENIEQILELKPDFVGFIFYEKSSRNVGNNLNLDGLNFGKTKKVGVFVDAETDFILEKIEKYGLEIVQLHGSETPDFCAKIRRNCLIFKAFGVDSTFDFEQLLPFKNAVDYFLFDTKTSAHGGSGATFDWEILQKIPADLPWILSGGLSLENIEFFLKSDFPKPFALDVNSRFEVSAGMKDLEKLEMLVVNLEHGLGGF
jgi:phosphoribosylanthranilate isomerase